MKKFAIRYSIGLGPEKMVDVSAPTFEAAVAEAKATLGDGVSIVAVVALRDVQEVNG